MSETPSSDEYSHFFEVRLDLFDGPIDLLLHLVKQRELPIEKLSLAAVAEQYLRCIASARTYDLEVAGEYLVIAATLLAIKSAILLNKPVEFVEDEDGLMQDPHAELVRRLKELDAIKHGAFMLSCKKQLGIDVFGPPPQLASVDAPQPTFKLHDPILLGMAFRKLLDKLPASVQLTIKLESISVVERMMEMVAHLRKASGPVVFHELVADLTNRASIVASFVGLLELCKRQMIQIAQSEVFGDITVALREGGLSANVLESEFDAPADEYGATRAIN